MFGGHGQAVGHHDRRTSGRRVVDALICGELIELGVCLPDVLQGQKTVGVLLGLRLDRQPSEVAPAPSRVAAPLARRFRCHGSEEGPERRQCLLVETGALLVET